MRVDLIPHPRFAASQIDLCCPTGNFPDLRRRKPRDCGITRRFTDNSPVTFATPQVREHEQPWRTRIGFTLLLSVLLLVAASKSVIYDTLDPDAFWHLRVAEQLQRDGIRPIVDDISFMSIKEPWTPYSWLAELAMKAIWDAGGYRAAIASQAINIAIIFLFIALTCIELTRRPRPYLAIALATMFAGYMALPYLSFRPVTMVMALIACCAWLLTRDRRMGERSRAVWGVPVIVTCLINMHLFALFVPMWCGALIVGALWERRRVAHWSERAEQTRRVKRYAALFACACFACLATPMLGGVLRSLAHYGKDDPMVTAQVIAELRPFWSNSMWPITLAVLLGTIGVTAWKRANFRIGEWLVLAMGIGGLLWMGRLAPLFVMIGAPMLATAFPVLKARLLARPLVWILLATVLLLGVVQIGRAFPSRNTPLAAWLNRHGPEVPGYPVGAARFVADRIPTQTGRIINDFNWGGYLAWELGPKYQVFMDARTQLYTPDFWRQTCLSDVAAVETIVRPISADAAIVPTKPKNPHLTKALTQLGWKAVYRDERATVLVPPGSSVGASFADVKENGEK
jgi:hypothetical protein